MKGKHTVNKSKIGTFLLCGIVCVGLVLSSMNCAGLGMSYGNISLNITDQPLWGPAGYDYADYYYIPDIDAYYSVSERQYIYRDGPSWVHARTLPSRYSGYDPYHSYKVVINEDKPYEHNDSHRAQYKDYKGSKEQQVIRDSHDSKYRARKDHPEHEKWVKEQNQ